MNRLILLVESRIRGDVYVRFGGELPKTHRSNTAGRWMLSLPLVEFDCDIAGKKRAMTDEDPVDLGVYEVDPAGGVVAIQPVFDGQEIYTNSGILYVNVANSNVTVFDITGKCVKSFCTGDSSKSVALEKGTYIVKIEKRGHSTARMIML